VGSDRMSIVPVGDVALFVREMGENDPDVAPLLVIHGGPDWDHTYLLPGLELVAQSRRVVVFDLRGCGQSTKGLGYDGYQPELVVGDVERLIGVLGHKRVDLLGFSTGGQVAQLFVEAHPGRVRRLILASTTAYSDVDRYLHGWAEYEARMAVRPPWPRGPDLSEDALATMLRLWSSGPSRGHLRRSGTWIVWTSTSTFSKACGSPGNGSGLCARAVYIRGGPVIPYRFLATSPAGSWFSMVPRT
jgi:pimeloyl-ACP methyl ester carboxylesterase